MQVASFLTEVEVYLIAHVQFVAAVAGIYARCIHLVRVAQNNAVNTSAYEEGHRVGRRVAYASVHHLAVVGIDNAPRYVGAPCRCIRTYNERGLNRNERVAQSYVVSAREIICGIYLQFVLVAKIDERRVEVLY